MAIIAVPTLQHTALAWQALCFACVSHCCSSALSQARLCRQQTKSSSHKKPICSLKCSHMRTHQWLVTHAMAIAAIISIDKCNTGTCSARATASRAVKRIIRWHAPWQTHRMAPSGFTNIGQAFSIVGGWPAAWQATATCDIGRERCSASRCANNRIRPQYITMLDNNNCCGIHMIATTTSNQMSVVSFVNGC